MLHLDTDADVMCRELGSPAGTHESVNTHILGVFSIFMGPVFGVWTCLPYDKQFHLFPLWYFPPNFPYFPSTLLSHKPLP